jgi:hypothetical protein
MTTRSQDEYLLVETRTGPTSERFIRDGLALARSGKHVRLFLVADAVGTAVLGASDALAELVRAGADVWVDDFTLTQRALPHRVLVEGVGVVTLGQVAKAVLADGTRTVWH